MHDCAHLAALIGGASRLRRLQSLRLPRLTGLDLGDAVAALRGLPGGGAGLQELRLALEGMFAGMQSPDTFVAALSAALAGLSGLRRLEARVNTYDADDAAAALGALGGAPAGARLALDLDVAALGTGRGRAAAAAVLRLPALGQLESLQFGAGALDYWLPQLLEPGTAAALTALDSLALRCFDAPQRPALVWSAPWLAQLTRLDLLCCRGAVEYLSSPGGGGGALPPGSLPALRALAFEAREAPLSAAGLDALLEACDPAVLQSLALKGFFFAGDAARRAEALPSLSSLHLRDGYRQWDFPSVDAADAAAFSALVSARLAPLTSLALRAGEWLLDPRAAPPRLGALLAAPWAAGSLQELHLTGCLASPARLRALDTALAQLPQLRALYLADTGLGGEAGRAALARAPLGSSGGGAAAAVWAPRLVAFALSGEPVGADELAELLSLPFSRLERFSVAARLSREERARALDACVRALPALKEVELVDSSSSSSAAGGWWCAG